MRRERTPFPLSLAATLAAALSLCLAPWPAAGTAPDAGRGLFFAQRCDVCHAVPAAGIAAATAVPGFEGPRLDSLAGRFSAEKLGRYLSRDESLPGRPHNRRFRGEEGELRRLVAWLLGPSARESEEVRVAEGFGGMGLLAPDPELGWASPQVGAGGEPSLPSDAGRAIFLAERCQVCHGLAAAGIAEETLSERLRGPDLSGLGGRYPAQRLARYLRRQETLGRREHLLAFRGEEEELQTLIAWLARQQPAAAGGGGQVRTAGMLSLPPRAPLPPALAAGSPGRFHGEVRSGFRTVEVDGARQKYREDIDLEEGFRLFELAVDLVPEPGERGLADHLRVELQGQGGDPHSSASLALGKDGRYDLHLSRRESTFFYADTLAATGPDLHRFDFERVRDRGELRLFLRPRSRLRLGFERSSREGSAATTRFLSRQVRDFFPVAAEIDDEAETFSAAFEQAWDRFTLAVEERYRSFETAGRLSLAGPVPGGLGSGARLDAYSLSQPYRSEAFEHRLRLGARPVEGLSLELQASFQDLQADLAASEAAQGVSGAGGPLPAGVSGAGTIDRELASYELDLSWAAGRRLTAFGSAWYRDYDQSATFAAGGIANRGLMGLEAEGAEVGVEVAVSPQLFLRGGVRLEERRSDRLRLAPALDRTPRNRVQQVTEASGFFLGAGWKPRPGLSLTAELDDSGSTQPFRTTNPPFTTLLPTDQQRLRLALDWQLARGLALAASYLSLEGENDLSSWEQDQDQGELSLSFERRGLFLSLGYGLLRIDQRVSPLFQFATVDANGVVRTTALVLALGDGIETDFFRGQLRWQASGWLQLGGDLLVYENRGDFPVERLEARAFLEASLPSRLSLRLAWRRLDYDETGFDADDYDGQIGELTLGYRW